MKILALDMMIKIDLNDLAGPQKEFVDYPTCSLIGHRSIDRISPVFVDNMTWKIRLKSTNVNLHIQYSSSYVPTNGYEICYSNTK